MRRRYRPKGRFANQLPPAPEAVFLQTVREAAHLAGFETYHTLNSKGSEPGWPDLVLAKPGRFIIAELKSERGVLTRDQRRWLKLLAQCPAPEVTVWRPSDLDSILGMLGLLQ